MSRSRLLAVVAALVLVATACGGGDSSSTGGEIASLATSGDAGEQALADTPNAGDGDAAGGSEADAAEVDPFDLQLEFAECMRSNGIEEFPDPTADGGFNRGAFAELGIDPQGAEFQSATDSCQEIRDQLRSQFQDDRSDEEIQESQENQLAIAECAREKGIEDFPDPDFSGNGPGGGLRQALQDSGLNIQEIRPVLQECTQELGIEGQGAPGGGQRGGAGN